MGTNLGGCGGDSGGTAVDIRASPKASRATWYGVEETWGLGGGLTLVGAVVGVRLDGGGGGRGAVPAMEAGARPLRYDTSEHQSATVATGVGRQTAGAPAAPPSLELKRLG